MSKRDLRQELATRVLLCDGAMGTQLFARGLAPGAPGEAWNLDRPDQIQPIHQAYRDAGCDLLTTNTFGASSAALARHALADRTVETNRQGAALAKRAAGDHAWVLGDIGPFGDFLEPLGDMQPDKLLAIFTQQALALKAGGADAVIVETMVDPAELSVAVRAARSVGDWPVLATFAFNKVDGDFRTIMGTTVKQAVQAAIEAGADVVGANCGTSLGFDDYEQLARQLVAAAGTTPVIVQPNAGSPATVDGRLVYHATPADLAALATRLVTAGVRIVGGCCGTTPDHLRAMAGAVKRA